MKIDLHYKKLWAVTDQTDHIGQTRNFQKKQVDFSHEVYRPAMIRTYVTTHVRTCNVYCGIRIYHFPQINKKHIIGSLAVV